MTAKYFDKLSVLRDKHQVKRHVGVLFAF